MAIAVTVDQDLLSALRHRPDTVWIRDGLALLGWGTDNVLDPGTGSGRYQRAMQMALDANQTAFASFTFDEDAPGSVVLLPELTIRFDRNGQTRSTRFDRSLPAAADLEPIPTGRRNVADTSSWNENFSAAMTAIDSGGVDKVVLSRAIDTTFESPLPIHSIVENLLTSQPLSHTYMVEGLVGSSPELLVELKDSDLRSVSLAGSADRTSPSSVESLDTPKMANEHLMAADSVETALSEHSDDIDRRAMEIATYGNIHHLATAFTGRVRPDVTVMDLLGSLHPTAAVAGTPTSDALALIRTIENHDRGRYAGPVGWFNGSGDGEFAIALRCGQVSNNAIRLFAGAGLVAGSTAQTEFNETEIKLNPMLEALGLR
jgi:menaquinone-specific isochorismate synthase